MSDRSRGRHGFRYQPFYCEENAWWLCAEPALGPGERQVVFIGNLFGHCPFAQQSAARRGHVIWWDYHCVVLDATRRIWDLDTRLTVPLPAQAWLAGSFPFVDRLPPTLIPRFRLISADVYRRSFASDRSHMRTPGGRWQHPPPPWPSIGSGMNLDAHRAMSGDGPGELLRWDDFVRRVDAVQPAEQ